MNKIAVISDIHSNFAALEAVIDKILLEDVDQIFCLGDLAGYGADINQTVTLIKKHCSETTIFGNHEKGLLTDAEDYLQRFNEKALAALLYQKKVLEKNNARWLQTLPAKIDHNKMTFCHGSPKMTERYLFCYSDFVHAFDTVEAKDERVVFYGHTHVPACVWLDTKHEIKHEELDFSEDSSIFTISLNCSRSYLVNPGSVGQPRDSDPRASFVIYDIREKKIHWHRVDYDIEKTQKSILEAGLPEMLGQRLFEGI